MTSASGSPVKTVSYVMTLRSAHEVGRSRTSKRNQAVIITTINPTIDVTIGGQTGPRNLKEATVAP